MRKFKIGDLVKLTYRYRDGNTYIYCIIMEIRHTTVSDTYPNGVEIKGNILYIDGTDDKYWEKVQNFWSFSEIEKTTIDDIMVLEI